jgi:hypothetical protein
MRWRPNPGNPPDTGPAAVHTAGSPAGSRQTVSMFTTVPWRLSAPKPPGVTAASIAA